MRKRWIGSGLSVLLALALVLALAGCGNSGTGESSGGGSAAGSASPSASAPASSASPASANSADPSGADPRTIEYLGESYTVPAKTERIVITGAMEALEDSLVLDVHPVGAITFGGKFPELYTSITDQAQSIGEKTQPNFETILKLKPDVILGSTKFPAETAERLRKIAPTILVSHIATNWEDNLRLLGDLTGKREAADREIEQYKAELEKAKPTLQAKLADKKVLAVRVRAGKIFIYPTKVFVNPTLYEDLGLEAPEEVEKAKAQEEVSIEQLAAINPDELFIQFADSENKETQTALDDLLANPIVKKTNAVKSGHVYVNVIDPLLEGGPAYSRIQFLKAVVEKLGNE
jgi:iron complex transport system substrate-binding protein